MRRVLAFDTATEAVAIGIGALPDDPGAQAEVLGTLDLLAPRSASEKLLPSVTRLLGALGIGPEDIDAVVVGRGPGSFTGVRIGVATAKGVARGLGVPLIGVGTLDAVAMRFAGHEGLVGIVGDAMRQEVYPALFRCAGGRVERLSRDRVAKPADAACGWAAELSEAVLLAGNGLAKYEAVFSSLLGSRARVAPRDAWHPGGAGLIAAAHAEALPGDDPGAVLPVYTRLSDAEEAEGRGGDLPACGVAGDGAGR